MENDCCLFEGFDKIQQNGVFLLGTSVSVLKISKFLCYANEGSYDVVNCATKMGKYSNIGAIIFKLGIRNVYHI